MSIDHLHNLTLGEAVGGIGEGLHDAKIARPHHHLEGAGIEEVADKNGCPVAPAGIGSGAASAKIAFINHIVVHQRSRMQELNGSAEIAAEVALIPQRSADENKERRTHALSAGAGDVFADFVHAADIACKLSADIVVNRLHVVRNGGEQALDKHLGVG